MDEQHRSVADQFLKRVALTPDGAAFMYPRGDGWERLTWKQLGDQVRVVAAALRALGLRREERCSLLSSSRIEWIFADLGILCAGGATSTIYPTSPPDECAHILKDSGARFAFVEDAAQVEKLLQRRADLPGVEKVITFDGTAGHDGWVIPFEEVLRLGREHDARDPSAFEREARAVAKEHLATIIYTSGTTGVPKGVELTHEAWLTQAIAIQRANLGTEQDVQYLWLPMTNAFAKVLLVIQLQVGFSTAIDGRIEKIVDNLSAIRPTFMCAVPRIFEKVHNRVVGQAKEAGGLRYRLFEWAMGVGRKVSALRQQGQEPSGLLSLQHALAHRLVFSRLHARFGGRLRFFLSGSAPLSRYLLEFFHAAGLLILEGYGMTETAAVATLNWPHEYRFGTVGKPVHGVEVKIDPKDGEILVRGPCNLRGYHDLPAATAEALDADGWLHTGDIGVFEDGFLRITDRKKDLIKTSNGKQIAPAALEGQLKGLCPYVSQVVVHGNNRNFCSALITLDDEAIRKWAAANGLAGKSYAELAASEQVHQLIQTYVAKLNEGLPSYSTLKKFALLPADLTLEAGELTASLKVRRKAVEQKYQHLLDAFYAGALEQL